MSESSRLYQLRMFFGYTQKEIAEGILGMGQNSYSMIETGKTRLTNKNRNILVEKLKVNPIWLETRIGDMFIDPSIKPKGSDKIEQVKGVPFYAKPINGSTIISTDDIARENPDYMIDFQPFNDCSFYRPVYGESMSPKYNPGDLVACKRISQKDHIMYGESYLCMIKVDGDFYETIKIIRRHKEDSNLVILKPLNPNFDESVMPLDSIIELYIIKGKIERNI